MDPQKYYTFILIAFFLAVASSLPLGGAETEIQNFQNERNFTAHYTRMSLPRATFYTDPVYDGNDTIYLFGGYGSYQILRFNISTETVELAATIDNYEDIGIAEWDKEGNILFFAGLEKFVFKFEPATSSYYLWDYSPEEFADATAERYNSSLYLFGGFNTEARCRVMRFNFDNGKFNTEKPFPYKMTFTTSTRIGNRVFIVGHPSNGSCNPKTGTSQDRLSNILIYNLEDGSSTSGPDHFIGTQHGQKIVNDGTNIYMMGTNGVTPNQGVVKIDPETFEWSFIYINGWPLADYQRFLRPPSSLYVEKLNRIYYFGGDIMYSNSIRDIWYIDLAELD